MNYATIKKCDIANGPGVRVSLFVSGCRHHCKGCFNAETWDFQFGAPYTGQTEQEIFQALQPDYVQGFTLLGGEPFEPENQPALAGLLIRLRERFPQKDIWCYTGYLFDKDVLDKMCKESEVTKEIVSYLDIVVDGEFMIDRKNLKINFRGSDNQRIIDVKKTLDAGEIVRWEREIQ